MTIKTISEQQTIDAGKSFSQRLNRDSAVLIYGEMGAGKTRFVKGMAQGLNIASDVTSPTFALVNDYGGLFHFDLFRIHSKDDLYSIGFYDYIGEGVIAVEWAENIPGLRDEFSEYHTVNIKKTDENTREITINDYSRT
jgi:tRNA threonylcarbamoyladenosine biosynthesis protein TsaE